MKNSPFSTSSQRFAFLALIFMLLFACQTDSETTEAEATAELPTRAATAVPLSETETQATPLRLTAVPTATPGAGTASPTGDTPGALVAVTMSSRTGVLLDDFPAAMRDRIADELLVMGDDFWLARAQAQIRLTRSRLTFRTFDNPGKGPLPLPPVELWQIELDSAGPVRETIDDHDLVLVDYAFHSTLLTDADSPGQSEPALADVGGAWSEPFIFPADPHLLIQRTGNACVNEGGYPAGSYDSENFFDLYDYTCQANDGGAAGCHRLILPNFSCREALDAFVGSVETAVTFERLPWDDDLANEVRLGTITHEDAPDLMVVADDLANNRLVYRYIEPDDCALEEGAVGAPGWRRLLQFDATVYNVGGVALTVGPVLAEDPEHNVFEYSACHDHFHYSYYGDFNFESDSGATSSKQAFCVQSTSRYSNHELSPLVHNYSCRFQGLQVGWVDEYDAGLDAQWIDVTELEFEDEEQTGELIFTSNSDQFLCEGDPVLDEDGQPVWEPSGFTTEDGEPIDRPQCEFVDDWQVNNEGSLTVTIPAAGSFVTAPCTGPEVGPLRNCGFSEILPDEPAVCIPGDTVNLTAVAAAAAPQVVRVCERSDALGGVACVYEDALANVVVDEGDTAVTFTCPTVRDASETTGGYSLYTAPAWPADPVHQVTIEQ